MSVFSLSVKPNAAIWLLVTLLLSACSTAEPPTRPTVLISASPVVASATPVPTIAPGFVRFSGRLTDATTGQPIAGGCVVIATGGSCQPASPRTDADGRWSIDLPVNVDWDFNWAQPGYRTETRRLHSTAGEQIVDITLQPTG